MNVMQTPNGKLANGFMYNGVSNSVNYLLCCVFDVVTSFIVIKGNLRGNLFVYSKVALASVKSSYMQCHLQNYPCNVRHNRESRNCKIHLQYSHRIRLT